LPASPNTEANGTKSGISEHSTPGMHAGRA